MDKKDFIVKKMKILMGEGKYNKAQAFAIANSYAEKEYLHFQLKTKIFLHL